MTDLELTRLRLYNQRLAGTREQTPEEVVRWMVAVQAQDYAAARWGLGLRVPGAIDADIERAVDAGEILRTHVLRPTWHFVLPEDIRWLLALTAPRVRAAIAYYERRSGLDEATFSRSNSALSRALRGGAQLTRPELVAALEQAGIPADGTLRSAYLLMRAELEGIICNGARRGKQSTYTLLDERIPQVRMLERDEALADLARRYFTSRGPATIKDFTWWSGLAAADARAGIELVKTELNRETIAGQAYWRADAPLTGVEPTVSIYLLPNFDEYQVAYADRSAALDRRYAYPIKMTPQVMLGNLILVAGRIAGSWKRAFKKGVVEVSANLFRPLSPAETEALEAAMQRYGEFVGMRVNSWIDGRKRAD